ncbi:MAG: radical SAM family heme chaperone HemW [Clostridiales bacterium]|nr:radical SAM family heme chaperone HemW [Clostridiales bacterium]
MTSGIYIHIPFCVSKCNYCNFLSFTGKENIELYKNALIAEIKNSSKQITLTETIYIGGGTPTSIPLNYLTEIIGAIVSYPLAEGLEFTAEANPGTVNYEVLRTLRNAGVNRLSFGLQTTHNSLLKNLGRIHTYAEFEQNYFTARQAGFTNINVDLMYALANETADHLKRDIARIISLCPEHISAYPLTIEENTPFENLKPADDSLVLQMFDIIKNELKKAGYNHYEISNFAKDGFASKHNLAYWQRKNYLGMGLGAHSFFNGRRFSNTEDLNEYIAAFGELKKLRHTSVFIEKTDAMEEFFFLGLRVREGIALAAFLKEFGVPAYSVFGAGIKKMIDYKLLQESGGRLFLTDNGINLSNRVFTEIFTAREWPRSL